MGCSPSHNGHPVATGEDPDSMTKTTREFLLEAKKNNGVVRIITHATGVLTDKYRLVKEIGRGSFAVVYEVRLKASRAGDASGRFACKTLSKATLSARQATMLKNEISILHLLSPHPNIVQIRDVYETDAYVFIVMDLCAGELTRRIGRGTFSQKEAAAIMRKMMEVVLRCHQLGVVHRDLKPENFLLTTHGDDYDIQAADFGVSAFYTPGTPLKHFMGTPRCEGEESESDSERESERGGGVASDVSSAQRPARPPTCPLPCLSCTHAEFHFRYMAPEVLTESYGPPVDVWALGVILYLLLSGKPPFWGQSLDALLENIAKEPVKFEGRAWEGVSDDCKHLLRKMLDKDPRRRISAKEALRHRWLREDGVAPDTAIPDEVVNRLKTFATASRLRKLAAITLAQSLPPEETKGLQKLFESIDTDSSGFICAAELQELLIRRHQQGGNSLRGMPSMAPSEVLAALADLEAAAAATSDIGDHPDGAPLADAAAGSPPARGHGAGPGPRAPGPGHLARMMVPPEAGADLILRIDMSGKSRLSLTEFYAATIPEAKLVEGASLRKIFDLMDTDRTGSLNEANLKACMTRAGMKLTHLSEIFLEADQNLDGVIDFTEFRAAMKWAGRLLRQDEDVSAHPVPKTPKPGHAPAPVFVTAPEAAALAALADAPAAAVMMIAPAGVDS